MKQIRVTFFFLAVALTLSGCGIFGGSDSTSDVSMAEDVEAQPTVNNVQPAPAETTDSTTDAGSEAGAPDDGSGDEATAALPTAVTLPTAEPTVEPTVDRSQPTTYVVQSGDVLGLIAERFDADIAELRRVNELDGNLIRVGQELTIPALDGSTEADSDDDDDTSGSASGDSGADTPAPTSAPAATVSCDSNATGHCIQPGESLLGIALKYDVTVEALRSANPGVDGDLIKSGQVLNLPGGSSDPAPAPTAAPSDPGTPAGTPVPASTAGPGNDADCAARNPDFPYFHAADGLCYANPIGGATAVPTAVGGSTDDTCPAGRFLWEDGLCYPIPGVTVTPTPEGTVTGTGSTEDYGRPPCRDGYVVILATNKCWPEEGTTPATVTPAAAATTAATASAGTEVACAEPNFTEAASGTCFLLQAGLDAGCSVVDNQAICP